MTLIVVHSPKGGSGSTFLTAHLAMSLARSGRLVTAVDFTEQDALKLYFGVLPGQSIVDMSTHAEDTIVVHGVELLSAARIAREQRFLDRLEQDLPDLLDPRRLTLVDVASGDTALKALLLQHARLHICPLTPSPASLATLPLVEPGTPTIALPKTVFVLNMLDDTRRLSRHTHSFLRQLFGPTLIGVVRRDEAVNEALASFQPLPKFAPSSAAIGDLMRLADAVEQRLGPAAGDVEAVTVGQRA